MSGLISKSFFIAVKRLAMFMGIVPVCLFLCAGPALADGGETHRVLEARTLRCAYIVYPPYLDIDIAAGEPKGIVPDLMNEIGKKLGINVVWTEEVSWGSMIEGIKSSRYDAVCSAIWQNAARSVHADFSIPFGYAKMEAWVRADETRFSGGLESFDDPGVRISTMDGEITGSIADDIFPKAGRVSLPQTSPFSDLLMNVKTGKADVAFVEPEIASLFLEHNPGALVKADTDGPVAVFPISIMLPKGETELKSMIDAGIQEVLYTRKLEKIVRDNGMRASLFMMPSMPYAH